MRGLLNSVSTPWLLLAAVVISLAVVMLAVLLVRRLVPATREGFHAEISAPMLGVVAALFGLFLAFVIIIAYQNFLSAGTNVSQETDSLSSIVRDSTSFPEPGGTNVRVAVGIYARAVAHDEWPLMRDGKQSPEAEKALNNIFGAFLTVKPTSPQAKSFYNDAVTQLNDASAAREDRIDSVTGGIPE